MMIMCYSILRAHDMRARYPRARSTIYRDINAGVMVPPISLGAHCVGWPAHEIDAILAARIAGHGDDDIRRLVVRLVAERQRAA
jgi:prophage regulatory protein